MRSVIIALLIRMQKLTGEELKYSAIVGKPSEITFRFAEHVLAQIAQNMHLPSPRTLYMIGSGAVITMLCCFISFLLNGKLLCYC